MRPFYSLLIAGILDWVIACIHIIAMFVGAKAYDFMDAPDLGEMARRGSNYPYFITSVVTLFFFLFGLYAFSGAGLIRRMVKLRLGLWIIGSLYVLRGLFFFVFLYFFLVNSPHSHPREIWFSLVALLLGILHLYGLKHLES